MSTTTHASDVSRSRLALMFTMLLCALTLSACIDSACNLVGPSESAGSHDETGDTLLISVYYERDETGSNIAPSSIRFRLNSSEVVVASGERETVNVPNIKQGDLVVVRADGRLLTTCTWNGKLKLFTDDAAVIYTPQVARANGGEPEKTVCQGWR